MKQQKAILPFSAALSLLIKTKDDKHDKGESPGNCEKDPGENEQGSLEKMDKPSKAQLGQAVRSTKSGGSPEAKASVNS